MIMSAQDLKVGMTYEAELTVEKQHLASSKGSGIAEVFSTPDLLMLMEAACFKLVEQYLDEGQSTVGISADFRHMAATPLGMKVTSRCELVEIDRKRLVFNGEVFDEVEKIGEGEHQRFIIDQEAFEKKAAKKAELV